MIHDIVSQLTRMHIMSIQLVTINKDASKISQCAPGFKKALLLFFLCFQGRFFTLFLFTHLIQSGEKNELRFYFKKTLVWIFQINVSSNLLFIPSCEAGSPGISSKVTGFPWESFSSQQLLGNTVLSSLLLVIWISSRYKILPGWPLSSATMSLVIFKIRIKLNS